MSDRIVRFLAAAFVFVSVSAAVLAQEEPTLGLNLASPEQLRGVPLAATPFSGEELPPAVDLSGDLPPPGNQGKQSACVGWAVAYALKSYQEKVEERIPIIDGNRVRADRVFSPAFVYNQINNGRDGGSFFVDALRLLSDKGAARWADMPYNERDFTAQPGAAALGAAKTYRISFWRQVNVQDLREVKAQLNAGYPVMIGASVDEGFLKARAGHMWKRVEGKVKGGHAMLVCGYEDRRNAFKLINSWGRDWGDNGYGWIDYALFPKVVNEGYVAKDAVNGPRPSPVRPDPVRPNPVRPDPVRPDPVRPDPVRPDPNIRPVATQLTFHLTKVTHMAEFPNRPDLGKFLRLDGTLTIPPGSGYANQTVIHFFFDTGGGRAGQAVRSRIQQFSDINGFAACGTGRYPIPPQGTNATWAAWIDYNAFILPPGVWERDQWGRMAYQRRTTNLVAMPTLFIDNFGVLKGEPVNFSVVGF